MNRYESYKDSGIPWLGEVPAHWDVKRLKFLGDIILGLTYSPENITNEDNGTLVLRSSNIQNGKLVFEDNVFVNSDIPQKMITTEQDILICSRNGSRSLIGKCALIEKYGLNQTFGAFMTVFRTPYRKFVYYALNSEIFKSQLGLFLTSTINQLTTQVLGNFNIAFPPRDEQTAIAHYLDTKLGEIDALIDKQQALLEKLAEQRTAVITHAVTKGLNSAAPMKNSGVEWLGDVPAHWDIKHSNQIFKIHNGATPKTSEPDYWGDEIVWFTPKDLGDNPNKEISTSLKMITKEGYENCGVSLAPAKSIALSKRAPIGHLAITLLPAVVNQGCFLLEVLAPNDVNYLYYWLYANKTTLNSFGQGSTFMELPREKFAMLKISTPPKAEQTSIAEYLDNETAKIDRLCETVNQTIGRLKEYRSALITQVVTGKIKVTDE